MTRQILTVFAATFLLLAGACALGSAGRDLGSAVLSDEPPLAATLTDEKVIAMADLSFAAAAETVLDAAQSGFVEPGTPLGERVRAARIKAYAAIKAAKRAQTLGETKNARELALLALSEARAFDAIADLFRPADKETSR